jgi:hypothetical protein
MQNATRTAFPRPPAPATCSQEALLKGVSRKSVSSRIYELAKVRAEQVSAELGASWAADPRYTGLRKRAHIAFDEWTDRHKQSWV